MMFSRSSLALVALALLCLASTGDCHGWLSFPESRNSRLNTVAPTGLAYNRMNGNGRAGYLPLLPIAQPGVCGDPFQGIQDPSLASYFAGQVTTTASFSAGQRVRFTWQMTTNHGGFVTFKICPRRTGLDQACFNANRLSRADGLGTRTYIFEQNGGTQCNADGICTINGKTFGLTMTTPEYIIPSNIACSGGCVLQWEYFTLNSCWTPCENNGQCTSGSLSYLNNNNPATRQVNLPTCNVASGSTNPTGNGERFHNCADIVISGGSTNPTPSPSPSLCSRFAAPGGSCGSGTCCPSGQCCSQWGWCGVTPSHCGAGCQRSWGVCSGARLARQSRRAGAFTNATELAEAMYGPAAADNLAAASAAPADIPAVPIGSASAASVVAEAGVAPPATEPVAAGVVDGSAANVAATAVAPAEAVASGGAGN